MKQALPTRSVGDSPLSNEAAGFNTASWAVLCAALLVFMLSLASAFYRNSLPSDGWQTTTLDRPNGQIVFREKLIGSPSPIRTGDQLISIEGQPLESLHEQALALRPHRPANWRVGETITYVVLRGGQEIALDVPLRSQPASLILRRDTSDILGIIVPPALLLISLFVFLKRPRDQAARLLFLFSVLLISTAGSFHPNDMFYSAAYWSVWLLEDLKWMLLIGPVLMHLVLTFPTEKQFMRHHPWLSVAAIYGSAPIIFLIGLALSGDWTHAFYPTYETVNLIEVIVFLPLMALSLGHSFLTTRDWVARAQLRWAALGFLVGLGGGITTYILKVWVFAPSPALEALTGLFFLALPLSLGVAILRYHLWDIDVIINRTLAYSTLTLSVVGLYVLVVGGLGSLLRAQDNLLLSLVATGLVALVFAPLKERLQRAVNRLMYGERDEPYKVISQLGQHLEATLAPDAVLPAIVQTIKEALRLPYAAIEFNQEGAFFVAASAGHPVRDPLRLPLVQQGESVGQLVLARRIGQDAFTAADGRLLEDLARQVGVAAHAVRLTADLQRSRERLVTAREEERRRLRRDLHDGLGPMLAGFTLQIGAIRNLLTNDLDAADRLLVEMGSEAETAVGTVRQLVYALFPPALDELGLVGAIRARAAQYTGNPEMGGLEVRVDAPESLPPLRAAVEVAAYLISQEALANVVRHAQAGSCIVRLTQEDNRLCIEVTDDGVGLPLVHHAGVGLHSMRERAEELGGTLRVEPLSPGGTRVVAHLPLPKE